MSIQIEYGPSAEPVSVEEVKAQLRLTTDEDDVMIGNMITAAREYAEKVTRRSLVYVGLVAYFDRFPSPGQPIRIPAPPLISVTSVKYLDTELELQTWDADEYFVASNQDPGLIVPKPANVYPVAAGVPGAVEVHFYAGYESGGYGDDTKPIPEQLRLKIIQLAGHYYDHPEVVSSEAQNEIPHGLLAGLRGYKVYVF